jgi:ankyrin repeat protein
VAVSILLRLGADPSAKDAGGNIPLHYAAVGRRGLAVERRGPNVRNNAGKTPVFRRLPRG